MNVLVEKKIKSIFFFYEVLTSTTSRTPLSKPAESGVGYISALLCLFSAAAKNNGCSRCSLPAKLRSFRFIEEMKEDRKK